MATTVAGLLALALAIVTPAWAVAWAIGAAALVAGWAVIPLFTWLMLGIAALVSMPTFMTMLPTLDVTLLRLALPAFALAVVAWRAETLRPRLITIATAATLALITAHVAYKQLFAIAEPPPSFGMGWPNAPCGRHCWRLLPLLQYAAGDRSPLPPPLSRTFSCSPHFTIIRCGPSRQSASDRS